MMEYLFAGFENVLNPSTLFWIAVGVSLGYVLGALPGLGKATGVAVSIPLTFYLEPVTAIAMLIGIAKGGAAGSAVSAILLNTPGEPSSAPTAMDGYPLARQGKAQKALKMGLFASVAGDLFSTLVLIGLAAPLAKYALLIGPVEICAILMFSLTFIGGLSGNSLTKGMIAGAFGIGFSTVGIEAETFVPRFTFGLFELDEGLSLIAIAIGMLAVAEMIVQAGNMVKLDDESAEISQGTKREDRVVLVSEWRRCIPVIARGSVIGSIVGILPGLGASVGSFLSYGATQRASKNPEKFGTGMIEGVAAAESADNAVVPSSLIPLFALGIPGSVIAAILIAALTLHGMTPGPLMFTQQPQKVADLYAGMLVASAILLIIGYFGQKAFALVIRVPVRRIVPVVLFLCCLGAYMQTSSLFSIYVMLVFALIGFAARKLEFSFITFLIGFVIGPNLELTFRQSIQILDRTPGNLINHPIAIVFFLLTISVVVVISTRNHREMQVNEQLVAKPIIQ